MIKVMTDNAANLPPDLRAQYAITELCLTYTIDGEPVDISTPGTVFMLGWPCR